jgi:hypothetical protein
MRFFVKSMKLVENKDGLNRIKRSNILCDFTSPNNNSLLSINVSLSFLSKSQLVERHIFVRAFFINHDLQLNVHIPSFSFPSLRLLIPVSCTGSVYCDICSRNWLKKLVQETGSRNCFKIQGNDNDYKIKPRLCVTIMVHFYGSYFFHSQIFSISLQNSQNGNLGKLKIDYG